MAGEFSDIYPEGSADAVMEDAWIRERVEAEADSKLLDELGIIGHAREQLIERLVLGRSTFRSMLASAIQFEDADGVKTMQMLRRAQDAMAEDKQPKQ